MKSFCSYSASITPDEQTTIKMETITKTIMNVTAEVAPQVEEAKKQSVLKRTIKIKKPTQKVKLVLVEEEDTPITNPPTTTMPKMPTEIQKAIVMKAIKMSATHQKRGYLAYHYKEAYQSGFVWTKGEDGMMRKVNCETIFHRDYRSYNEPIYNWFFDVRKCKQGGVQREGYATEHTTNAKQSKIYYSRETLEGEFTGYKLEDLRAYMVNNGLTSTDARFLNYKQRVQWIMTADYDEVVYKVGKYTMEAHPNTKSEVWSACLERLEKVVTKKEAKKSDTPSKKK